MFILSFAIGIASIAAQDQGYISLSSLDTATLVTDCAQDRGLKLDLCASYILGVADALQMNKITCRAQGDAATLQTVAIVRKYIRENPEQWNKAPVVLVQTPLIRAFPCKKAG